MAFVLLCTAGASGQDLAEVPNGDFERAATDTSVPLWNNNADHSAGTVRIDTDSPHAGLASMRLQRSGDSGGLEVYSSLITVSGHPYTAAANETWRLSYWVRTEGTGKFHCLLRTQDQIGTTDFRDKPIHWWTLGAQEPAAPTAWVRRQVEVDLPRGNQFLYVLFALSGPEGSRAWIDEVALRRVDGPPPAPDLQKPRKIARLIYLSHPYAYEFAFHHDPIAAAKLRIGDIDAGRLLEMEREVGRWWVRAIEQLGPDDFLIINGLGMGIDIMTMEGALAPVWKAAREHLGGRYLVTYSSYGATERFGTELRKRLTEMDYELDPATVKTEGWGGSFEGCLPAYACRIASSMGLDGGFPANVDLVYFDAPFAMQAASRKPLPTAEPGVHLYLFRHPTQGEFAIFFPRSVGDAGPLRHIHVNAPEGSVRFTNKAGEPRSLPYRDGYLIPLGIDGIGEPIYLWNVGLSRQAFEDALTAAVASAP